MKSSCLFQIKYNLRIIFWDATFHEVSFLKDNLLWGQFSRGLIIIEVTLRDDGVLYWRAVSQAAIFWGAIFVVRYFPWGHIYLFIYLFFIYLFIYFLFIYLFNYLFWEGSRVSEGHFPKVLRFSYFPSKLHGLRRRDFQRMISEHIICRFVLNWKPSSLFFFYLKIETKLFMSNQSMIRKYKANSFSLPLSWRWSFWWKKLLKWFTLHINLLIDDW